MTEMLLPLDTDVDYGTDAEVIAKLYSSMLEDHGWQVEVAKTHAPGHYDASGRMWAKETLNVMITAKRNFRREDGYLVVSWTSVMKAPKGVELTTRRNLGYRQSGDVLSGSREVVTNRDFFSVIGEMTR